MDAVVGQTREPTPAERGMSTMSEPSTTPGPESGGGPRFDACMKALRDLRDSLVRSEELPFGGLKDTHLRLVLTRGHRNQKNIAKVLPAAYAHLAPAILAAIVAADPIAEPPPPVESSPSRAAKLKSGHPETPGPAKTPTPTPPSASSTDDLEERARQFAPLDWSEEFGSPTPLSAAVKAGSVELRWEPPPESTEDNVYRVVAKDEQRPWDPGSADLLDITFDLMSTDTRDFSSGVRYFQVWRNSGPTPTEAMARQPRLHAETAIVAPVQEPSLREDAGRVIGQWWVFPDITRVHVYRIPIERAERAGQDPQYLLETGDANLSGFIDRGATRGKRYLYRFYAVALINGVATSSNAVAQVLPVSALLNPVEDLRAIGHGDQDDYQFDLAWTAPPSGRVVIYRTDAPPTAGLETETRDEASLAGAGLSTNFRLAHPAHQNPDGTTEMREVPSPQAWDRVYFTPVTLLEGKARVGRSVSSAVIPTPEEPVVVERTQYQLLKFGWPGKAAAVAVSIGPRGQPAATPAVGPSYLEISRETYERLGGLQFPKRLPPDGCSVHLAGVDFVNRQRFYGEPVVADYQGLRMLMYSVEVKRSIMHNPDRVLVRLAAEREATNLSFVLVHNPDRLPLHPQDGEALEVVLDVEEVTPPSSPFVPARLGPRPTEPPFRASVRGRTGFVRVFAQLPAEVLRWVALMDPPVKTLILRA